MNSPQHTIVVPWIHNYSYAHNNDNIEQREKDWFALSEQYNTTPMSNIITILSRHQNEYGEWVLRSATFDLDYLQDKYEIIPAGMSGITFTVNRK